MDNLFKKFLYAGVGIASTAADRLQKEVNEWVEKGKLSEDEGKKVVDDLVKDTETKREEYEGKIKDYIEKFLAKFDFPSRDEIKGLQAKIDELETKLAATKEDAPEKTTAAKTKTAAKKRTTTSKTTTKQEENEA